MLEVEKVMVEHEILKSKICDICGKKHSEDDAMEFQEFFHIRAVGGYGSVFGDGNKIAVDICQHCFKERFGEFVRTEEDGA